MGNKEKFYKMVEKRDLKGAFKYFSRLDMETKAQVVGALQKKVIQMDSASLQISDEDKTFIKELLQHIFTKTQDKDIQEIVREMIGQFIGVCDSTRINQVIRDVEKEAREAFKTKSRAIRAKIQKLEEFEEREQFLQRKLETAQGNEFEGITRQLGELTQERRNFTEKEKELRYITDISHITLWGDVLSVLAQTFSRIDMVWQDTQKFKDKIKEKVENGVIELLQEDKDNKEEIREKLMNILGISKGKNAEERAKDLAKILGIEVTDIDNYIEGLSEKIKLLSKEDAKEYLARELAVKLKFAQEKNGLQSTIRRYNDIMDFLLHTSETPSGEFRRFELTDKLLEEILLCKTKEEMRQKLREGFGAIQPEVGTPSVGTPGAGTSASAQASAPSKHRRHTTDLGNVLDGDQSTEIVEALARARAVMQSQALGASRGESRSPNPSTPPPITPSASSALIPSDGAGTSASAQARGRGKVHSELSASARGEGGVHPEPKIEFVRKARKEADSKGRPTGRPKMRGGLKRTDRERINPDRDRVVRMRSPEKHAKGDAEQPGCDPSSGRGSGSGPTM